MRRTALAVALALIVAASASAAPKAVAVQAAYNKALKATILDDGRGLTPSLRPLALKPAGQHPQGAHRLVYPLVQVGELCEACLHGRDGEVLHLDVRELVPPHGRRHGRVRPPANGVRRQDRAVARVLVVVDEHLLAALLLPPRGRHQAGGTPLDLTGEGAGAAADDTELPVRLDAAVHVHAAVAARLRPAHVADLAEHLVDDGGDALRLREAGAGLRVDVDAQLVRLLRIAPPRRPRAELERGEGRRPPH